jgi:hypothetical protein
MASADDVAALRRLVNIPDDNEPYTDLTLSGMIDARGSVEAAGAQIWRELAASFAQFVDTTESGSSRKMSDLASNALKMASQLDGVVTAGDTGAAGRSFVVPVSRV